MDCLVLKKGQLIVLHNTENSGLYLKFNYINNELNFERIFNLEREANENCLKVLSRLHDNIVKFLVKKKKKNKNDIQKIPINILCKETEEIIDTTTKTCIDIFINDKYILKINDIKYYFDINPPLIKNLSLPKKNIMANFILYPIRMEALNCDLSNVTYLWYKSKEKFTTYEMYKKEEKIEWEFIKEDFNISPTTKEINSLIKVVAVPQCSTEHGCLSEHISNCLVSAGPGNCLFEDRHQFTSSVLSNDFLRVVSYNVLADLYADSDYTRSLYPNCPAYALEIDYRTQLLIKEITGYNGDILCLQEVDEKVFLRDYQPNFKRFGFEGVFKSKGGETVSEGLATFYRTDKLDFIDFYYFHLGDELMTNPLFSELRIKIETNECLLKSFCDRTSILHVTILRQRSDPNRFIVVGNTHLYFGPIADHIRLLQAAMAFELLQHILELHKTKHRMTGSEGDVSLIFCGDFNSSPGNSVYRYLLTQVIDENDEDWFSTKGEEIIGVSYSHNLEMESACGTPQYTNYTMAYKDCLDYIFYQKDKLSVERIIPLPTEEELSQQGALPSIIAPSDHIALVADFKFIH